MDSIENTSALGLEVKLNATGLEMGLPSERSDIPGPRFMEFLRDEFDGPGAWS